jgi:hypothetical protein
MGSLVPNLINSTMLLLLYALSLPDGLSTRSTRDEPQ